MDVSLEERTRDWIITTWYFLHNGILPNELDMRIYANEALLWGERNRAVVERFASIHARRNVILLAKTHTPQALASTRAADLWSIQTPADNAAINQLLEDNVEVPSISV